VRGVVDPSSFIKNASKVFQAYADNVEQKANAALRGSGYTGSALRFTRTADLPKPKATERELDLQTIVKSEYSGLTTDPVAGVRDRKRLVDPLSEEAPENIDRLIGKLAGRARAGDESAWKDLEIVRDTAVDPSIKQRVEVLLVERPR
jgi:hypothetical protein